MNIHSYDEYRSRRSPVVGTGPMVATSQPAASLIGMEILRSGGTAADAAIGVAAALQVTQPCSTGLGGDAFFLYKTGGESRVEALNGSGHASSALTFEAAAALAADERLPPFHAHTVTVPGAAGAWAALSARHGRLSLAECLEPAARLAEEGFAVAPMTALWWARGAERQLNGRRHGAELLADGGPPRAGSRMTSPTLARTLRALGREGSDVFYRGWIAERIVEEVRHEGGGMTLEDMASYEPEWVEPIGADFGPYRVFECPPNGQGLAALIAMRILENSAIYRDLTAGSDSALRYHLQIEAMRLAFCDAAEVVADPRTASIPVDYLLSDGYCSERAAQLRTDTRVQTAEPGDGARVGTDTVYFCVVDEAGNGCSFINSNYMGFGTGIVPRGCGFSLQNRGHGFLVRRGHPNAPAARKRPYHTIIPGMAVDRSDPERFMLFGVMGGMMQPQGHLQVVDAVAGLGLDPQAALDRARFSLDEGRPNGRVLVESDLDGKVLAALADRGHPLRKVHGRDRAVFGLGQIILVDDAHVRWAGSDPRGDGLALGR